MLTAPQVSADEVSFALTDRFHRLTSVRLDHELDLAEPVNFSYSRGIWTAQLDRPPVDRLEYLLEIVDHNAHVRTITDPSNSQRVAGAFGAKSVITFPGYHPPAWLGGPAAAADAVAVAVDTPELDDRIEVLLWSPQAAPVGVAAPLVVVHDGPEFELLGRFTDYIGTLVAAGVIPPCRVALLGPGDRNEWYAANPAYAAALVDEVLREIELVAPAPVRIGVGVSLGALAMLHAHVTRPGTFDALMLESGSFFTPELDPQEAGFPGFAAVSAFVAQLTQTGGTPIPTVLACGLAEENLANNRAMAAGLAAHGYSVEFVGFRDAHNYTGWRDALDPYLAGLIKEVTG